MHKCRWHFSSKLSCSSFFSSYFAYRKPHIFSPLLLSQCNRASYSTHLCFFGIWFNVKTNFLNAFSCEHLQLTKQTNKQKKIFWLVMTNGSLVMITDSIKCGRGFWRSHSNLHSTQGHQMAIVVVTIKLPGLWNSVGKHPSDLTSINTFLIILCSQLLISGSRCIKNQVCFVNLGHTMCQNEELSVVWNFWLIG